MILARLELGLLKIENYSLVILNYSYIVPFQPETQNCIFYPESKSRVSGYYFQMYQCHFSYQKEGGIQ